MQLKKLVKYKDTCIKVYYVKEYKPFCYEYTFKQKGKLIKDRSSWTSIQQCLKIAKEDYNSEETS